MTPHQLSLLNPGPALPPGLRYQPDLISSEEEQEVAGQLAALPFGAFEFQGYLGKRRVLSFGWQYDFSAMQIRRAEDLPPFLLDLRERAAGFAGLASSDLQQVLLTEYAPGAGIGWHKDKPMFAEVVGLSLLSRCVFRLRAKQARLGSGAPSYSSHARPTCFKVLPEPTGSTASRPWTACATRSRSGPSGLNRLPRDPIGPRLLRSSLEARLQLEVIEAVDRANLDVVHRAIPGEIQGHDSAGGTQCPDLAVEAGQVCGALAIHPRDNVASLHPSSLSRAARNNTGDNQLAIHLVGGQPQ